MLIDVLCRHGLFGEQRELFPPRDEGDVAMDDDEQLEEFHAPAEAPRGFGKNLSAQDGDYGAMHLKRAGAVNEHFAEALIVVEADELPEKSGASLDVADV